MEKPIRYQLAERALTAMTGNISLDVTRSAFVMEYSIDHNHRRAARTIGLNPDDGIKFLNEPAVQEAVRVIWLQTLEPSNLSAAVLKEEMFKVYQISLHEGNLSQAGRQLDMLAKHADIDAYAAQKVSIAADAEIAKRLKAGRARASQANTGGSTEEEVSFL